MTEAEILDIVIGNHLQQLSPVCYGKTPIYRSHECIKYDSTCPRGLVGSLIPDSMYHRSLESVLPLSLCNEPGFEFLKPHVSLLIEIETIDLDWCNGFGSYTNNVTHESVLVKLLYICDRVGASGPNINQARNYLILK